MSKEFGNDDTAEAFATQDQLRQLYGGATSWLNANADVQYPPSGIIDTHADLPITDEPLYRGVTIPGDALRTVLPTAADELRVGDAVEIVENLPGWLQARSGHPELDYSEPLCRFTVRRPEDDPIVETDIFVQETDEGGRQTYITSRSEDETRMPDIRSMDDIERLRHYMSGRAVRAEVGGNELTNGEYLALQDVVDRLDELHNWQPPEGSADNLLSE